MSVYVDEINNIENEMKRVRKHLKQLRELKKKPTQALHQYMVANNFQIYKGIKIEKISPPLKIPNKTPTQKKHDALEFFRNAGGGNPEQFYQQYILTQKRKEVEEE